MERNNFAVDMGYLPFQIWDGSTLPLQRYVPSKFVLYCFYYFLLNHLFLYVHFRKITMTHVYFSKYSWNLKGCKVILRHTYRDLWFKLPPQQFLPVAGIPILLLKFYLLLHHFSSLTQQNNLLHLEGLTEVILEKINIL